MSASASSVNSNIVPVMQNHTENATSDSDQIEGEEIYQHFLKRFEEIDELTSYYKTIKYDPKNITNLSIRRAFDETINKLQNHTVLGVDTFEKLAIAAVMFPHLKTLTISIAGGYEGTDLILPKGLQEVRLRNPKGNLDVDSALSRKVKLVGAKQLNAVVACLCFLDRDNHNLPAIEIPDSVTTIEYDATKCPRCCAVGKTTAGMNALLDLKLTGTDFIKSNKAPLTFIRLRQRFHRE